MAVMLVIYFPCGVQAGKFGGDALVIFGAARRRLDKPPHKDEQRRTR